VNGGTFVLENYIIVRKWLLDDGMHLITQPCSNSVMMGNNGTNRILYHDIAAQTITESPPCFTGEPGIPDFRLPWVFSKRKKKKLPGVGNSMKDDSSNNITRVFRVVWCPGSVVVTPSFTHLSVVRGLAIAGLPWMLDLWSSSQVETGSSEGIFDSAAVNPCWSSSFIKSSVYNDLFLSMSIFPHCPSSLMSSHDSCVST
jgi:hypothetical protein